MKKFVFGIAAVVLASAAVAFTTPKKVNTFTSYYFPTNAAGVPQAYVKAGNMPYTSPQLGCSTGATSCEIANDNFSAANQGGGNFLITPTGNNVAGTETKKD